MDNSFFKKMDKFKDLRDKHVLITGAASGIGLAVAREFSKRRAIPIILDINKSGIEKVVAELRGGGYEGYGFAADITDIQKLLKLREELDQKGLTPEILVNCAGLTLVCHISETTYEDWTKMIGVNVMGTINTIHTFLPAMLEKSQGHIVNISSIDGLIPIPGQAAYCASKFAVTGLTDVIHFDLKHRGVGVTLVCPGSVNTPMAQSMPVRDMPLEFPGSRHLMKLVEFVSSSPENIAREIANAVCSDKYLVIPGFPSRTFYRFRRLFPKLATKAGLVTSKVFDLIRRKRKRNKQDSSNIKRGL